MTGFVAATMTCKNEVDIIGHSIRHLFAQGVEQILMTDGMSTDGTRDLLADLGREFPRQLLVVDDREPYHRQPYWMNKLAGMACEAGARWIVATDADEFWLAADRSLTVAEVLGGLDVGVTKLYASMWQHLTFELREPNPKPLPKVAYRAFPFAVVHMGNHDVSVPGGNAHGLLEVHEIQYRGFDHFCRKIVDRNATVDPSLPVTAGAHHRRYDGWTRRQLEPVWAEMVARATVHDPIMVSR